MQKNFIKNVIEKFHGRVLPDDFIFKYSYQHFWKENNYQPSPSDYLIKDVVLWDPVSSFSDRLFDCPSCYSEVNTLTPTRWKDGSKTHDAPRQLYGLHHDAILVSRVYTCQENHQILAHDQGLLYQTNRLTPEPFILFHRCGLTRELFTYILSHINAGVKTSDILTVWQQLQYDNFARKKAMYERTLAVRDQLHFDEFPQFESKGCRVGERVVQSCLIYNYYSRENLFSLRMSQMTASMLCADHTFKIPANIGVWKNGTWLKVYDGLFMVLNEVGVVTAWQLTKGTKFEAIQDLLIRLKSRMDRKETKVEMFCIDNCCQWRNLLNEIFPDTQIKLDIFHALQRIVSKIPKRKGTSMQQRLLRNQLLKSLRLILREPCDSGDKRLKETPSPGVILTNIKNFRKQWASVKCEGKLIFPEAAESALNNLEVHVDNGCLSYIPKGYGTNRNEGLHRILNKSFKSGRRGIQQSIALLGNFFYR